MNANTAEFPKLFLSRKGQRKTVPLYLLLLLMSSSLKEIDVALLCTESDRSNWPDTAKLIFLSVGLPIHTTKRFLDNWDLKGCSER